MVKLVILLSARYIHTLASIASFSFISTCVAHNDSIGGESYHLTVPSESLIQRRRPKGSSAVRIVHKRIKENTCKFCQHNSTANLSYRYIDVMLKAL